MYTHDTLGYASPSFRQLDISIPGGRNSLYTPIPLYNDFFHESIWIWTTLWIVATVVVDIKEAYAAIWKMDGLAGDKYKWSTSET